MPASKSSSRRRNSKRAAGAGWGEILAALLVLAALSAAALAWFFQQGYLLYYGDAEAHLNIARRLFDSRTPDYRQIGTVWLPLPHLLIAPFAKVDAWWRSGLAGGVPTAGCFVVAGMLLYASVRRLLPGRAPAVAATALFALNPNLLYLQSTAMTEPVFFAALAAILYCTVRFRQTQSRLAAAGAGLAVLAATLTRYEGWFLAPFVGIYFLIAARNNRIAVAALFGLLAVAGPLYWLGHNWWIYGNPLEFYNGPYSAKAIYQRSLDQGMERYAGDGDWGKAWLYFTSAARLCAGWPLAALGLAGVAAALIRRTWWPVALLALSPAFYVWSVYASGTPIFVPHLWPSSYYNTRYGLAALPLLCFGVGALVSFAPQRFRTAGVSLVVVAGLSPWLLSPTPEAWICWKESQVNSEARRAWTREAAEFLRANIRPGDRIFTSFSDLTGIYREAGIPLRATLHEGNEPEWQAAAARPDLFLRAQWAVGFSGDKVTAAAFRTSKDGPGYQRVKTIMKKGAPVVEIYRRSHEDSIHQGAWRPERLSADVDEGSPE